MASAYELAGDRLATALRQLMQDGRSLVDKTTLWSWGGTEERRPAALSTVLRLARELDVDPLLLVRLPRSSRFLAPGGIRRAVRPPDVLERMVLPSTEWPPVLEGRGPPRRWFTRCFGHVGDDGWNTFARVRLSWRSGFRRMWHFAFRPLGSADKVWRPYGAVAAWDGLGERILWPADLSRPKPVPGMSVCVDTWFGPEPAEFLIASLHPFESEVTVPAPQSESSREADVAPVFRFGREGASAEPPADAASPP